MLPKAGGEIKEEE